MKFSDCIKNLHTCWLMHRIYIHTILAHSVDGCYGSGRFLNLPSNQSKSIGNKAKLVIQNLAATYSAVHVWNCLSFYCSIYE
jgi:hypothetical protein